MKRWIALLLAVMSIGTVSMTAYAEDEEYTEETYEEEPYEEESYEEEPYEEESYEEESYEEESYEEESYEEESYEEESYEEESYEEESYEEESYEEKSYIEESSYEEVSIEPLLKKEPLGWQKSIGTVLPIETSQQASAKEESKTVSKPSPPPYREEKILNIASLAKKEDTPPTAGLFLWSIVGIAIISLTIWLSRMPSVRRRRYKKYSVR